MLLTADLNIPLASPRPQRSAAPVRKLLRHLEGNDYSLEMDWSSIESFLTCDRASEYRLIYSRSTYPSAPLTYGQAIHAALEVWYKAQMATDDVTRAAMIHAGEKVFLANPMPIGEWRTFDHFVTAIHRYIKRYANEPFVVLPHEGQPAVELSFCQPLTVIKVDALCPYPRSQIVIDSDSDSPFHIANVHVVWTGIIDLIVQQGSSTWIVDHKTASRTGEAYFRAFDLSQQIIGYVWAARQLFPSHDFQGAIMNIIVGRQPTKTGTAWDQEREYKRFPQSRIDEWPLHMTSIIEDFLHHLTKGFFPMKTQWCSGKFGVCPFLDVCTMDTHRGRMLMLQSDRYADNVWNPLNQEEG